MAWCLRPSLSLSTVSNIPDKTGSSRYLSFFPNSWPSDPSAYELTKHIGDGSSASVYQAHCKQLQATVAVKKLDLDGHCDLAALIREAALLRRFQHRHVLLLYTSFVVGRELWMVMPYMDLGSVRSIMRKAYPQGLDEVLIATIMRSTLQALEYVHKNGGIHRDIKADNILVNSSGEVRLADFGVASDGSNTMSFILDRMLSNSSPSSNGTSGSSGSSGGSSDGSSGGSSGSNGGSTSSSGSSGGCDCADRSCAAARDEDSVAALRASLLALRANTFVGTPCWMAPEVMQQLEEGYNNTADIWSVGITVIELATGRPPLARCHPLRVLSETVHCPPPTLPPDSSGRKYSKALRDLVTICLQKDPSKRPSAAELLQHRFFKAARDSGNLSSTLLTALLQPHAVEAPGNTVNGTLADSAQRVASTPALPYGTAGAGPGSFSASREVHSEPLMTRIRSILGLGPGLASMSGPGLGSFLGPQVSKLNLMGRVQSGLGGRDKSQWRLATAAGVGMGLRGHVGCSAAPSDAAAAAVGEVSGPAAAAAAVAAGQTAGPVGAAASAAGSLSRSGSRGVKVSMPAAEAARYSWYAK